MNFNLFGRKKDEGSSGQSATNYEALRQLAAQTLNDFETSEQVLAEMARETGQDIDTLRIQLSNLTKPYYGE